MYRELRKVICELFYDKDREKNIDHPDFLIGLYNRLALKQQEKRRAKFTLVQTGQISSKERKRLRRKLRKLERRLVLIKTARKIEDYREMFPDYLQAVPEKERKLLGKYARQRKIELKIWGKLRDGELLKSYLALDKNKRKFLCLKLMISDSKDRAPYPNIEEKLEYYEEKWREIFHNNIINIYDCFTNHEMYIYQEEYFPGLALDICWEQILRKSLKEKLILLKEILEGIKCLHLFNWIHCDIHATNILVDILGNNRIKIVDSGLSTNSETGNLLLASIQEYGHAECQPPEIQSGESPSACPHAIDIWSFGAIAYRLLNNIDNSQQNIHRQISPQDFPSEIDHEVRKILAKALAQNPQERPSAREIHHKIRSWCQKQAYTDSLRVHQRLRGIMEYLSQGDTGKITVETDNGEAHIYFEDGQLLEAEYCKMRGREVIEELCDEVKLLYHVDLDFNSTCPQANEDLSNFVMTDFLLRLAAEEDTVRRYRWQLQKDLCKHCLGIESAVVCTGHCTHSGEQPPRWPLDYLLYATDVFLYAQNRHQLTTWCQACILKEIDRRKAPERRLSKTYHGYQMVYLSSNMCAQFYLGFKLHQARSFILYLKPPRLKNKRWQAIIERIRKGCEILQGYPCRHFVNFREFEVLDTGKETFAILSTEYFPGISLRQILHSNIPRSKEINILILLDLAKALAVLHKKGIVHRNVNPSSILVGVNGQVKLGDFSLCKYEPGISDDDHYYVTINMSQSALMGRPPYSSPEHLKNSSQVGPASDIWSWGIVAYELLVGQTPFSGTGGLEKIQAIREQQPDFSLIDEHLRNLVQMALIKDSNERLLTAETLVHDLRNILNIDFSSQRTVMSWNDAQKFL